MHVAPGRLAYVIVLIRVRRIAMNDKWLGRVVSRRRFGKGAVIAGVGAASLTTLGGLLTTSKSVLSPLSAEADGADVDILNFALNLEYLEAEFYTVVTTGQTIDQIGIGIDGAGTLGPTTGGAQVQR